MPIEPIDRRDFLKSGSVALAGIALAGGEAFAADTPHTTPGRVVLRMNRNWRFSATRAEGDTSAAFNDAAFARVTIPHTNKVVPWHSFDEKAYQFVSIYRRTFQLPEAMRGKHVFADFDGAMTAAKVWINGKWLGEYKGGYTPFSFELTR